MSILWHNSATNETQTWLMDNAKVTGRQTALGENGQPAFVGPPWSIVGTGDFNRDEKTDILWHNSVTSETQIWLMDGAKVIGRETVLGENGQPAFVGPPWSIVGTGDFNQDKKTDILWHNSSTNETQIWLMNGARVIGRETVVGENGQPAFVGLPWSIVATGDFNGDGKADILWHNATTNETQVWLMDGFKVSGRATILGENGRPAFVGPPWSIVGAADFNLDRKADILWHNSSTNETQLWLVDGGKVTGRATVLGENGQAAFIGLPWSIVGVGFVPPPKPTPPPVLSDKPRWLCIDAPDIVFGTGISVGGYARLTIFSDGTTHFTGHLHDSGFPSYDCLATFTFKDTDNHAYVASHSGRVHGTDESGSRNLDWDDWGTNADIQKNWSKILAGGGYKVEVTSDWSAQKIAEDIVAVFGIVLAVIPLIFSGGGSSNKSNDPDYGRPEDYPPGGLPPPSTQGGTQGGFTSPE